MILCQSCRWVWKLDCIVRPRQRSNNCKALEEIFEYFFPLKEPWYFIFRLSEKEKEQISEQLNDLNKTYHDLCDGSANQLQQLQSQLAQQTEQKVLLVLISKCWERIFGMVWKQLCWLRVMITSYPWPMCLILNLTLAAICLVFLYWGPMMCWSVKNTRRYSWFAF